MESNSNSNRFAMMMEAWAELLPEIDATRPTQTVPSMPSLGDVLAEFGPMPDEALFLGVASDGLPVLLNLHDPVPGPILISSDSGTGKTALLQNIAAAAGKMHRPEELQFGVLTNHPEEWNRLESIPNNVGIFPLYHQSAEDFLLSLASWAHGNKTSQQSVILLLDDLEAATNLDFDAKQNLRWLLMRGPARRVWTFTALNPDHMENISLWLDAFHTRILGPIENPAHIRAFDAEHADLNSLAKGTQFTLREGEQWLRFWIPDCE
jgi:hypothetical protein